MWATNATSRGGLVIFNNDHKFTQPTQLMVCAGPTGEARFGSTRVLNTYQMRGAIAQVNSRHCVMAAWQTRYAGFIHATWELEEAGRDMDAPAHYRRTLLSCHSEHFCGAMPAERV